MEVQTDIERLITAGKGIAIEKAGKRSEPFWERIIRRGKISPQDRARFCLELSVMLQAGVSLHRGLQVLIEQVDKKPLKGVLQKLEKEVQRGNSFSSALSLQPAVFDDLFVVSAEVGQESGRLPQVMSSLALYLEKMSLLRRKFIQALAYPCLVLSVAVNVVLFLLLVVVPSFSEMFASMAAGSSGQLELPFATRIIMTLSGWLSSYGYVLLLIVVLASVSLRSLVSSRRVKSWMLDHVYRIPAIGSILTKNLVARFCRTLGTLLQARVSLIHALEVTQRIMANDSIQAEVRKIIKHVKQGKTVAEPIVSSKFFPPMVSQMITVGEETSELDSMLFKVAEYYEKEVDTAVDSLSNVLEPVLILVIGTIVAAIVISMYLPMFEMMNVAGG